MKMTVAIVVAMAAMPTAVLAGNTAAASVRAGPASVAPPAAQVQAALPAAAGGLGATSAGSASPSAVPSLTGFSTLPGAYQAAIANGALPAGDGTVQVTISGSTLTVDSSDRIVR